MDDTKIDWCDSTWNPVTGCRHGCPYCYARNMTVRFGKHLPDKSYYASVHDGLHMLDNRIEGIPYPFGFDPTFHAYRIGDYAAKKKPRNIFVCSMADLFGEWIPDEWIKEIFDVCMKSNWHNYLFLTKNPVRYLQLADKGMLPHAANMWYGTTATCSDDMRLVMEVFGQFRLNIRSFLSIEPLHEDIMANRTWQDGRLYPYVDWVIVGAETGNRKGRIIPEYAWVNRIKEECEKDEIPLFMKGSLDGIWGSELIQQFPKELEIAGNSAAGNGSKNAKK